MDIWISWNIDIGRSLNCRDSFSKRKFKNWAPISYSPGHILWQRNISFELRAKTAEEIDLEKCTFRNFRSSVTLTLTLDRVKVTLTYTVGPTCRTSSWPNHVTVVSRITEIWPFEFRQISTLDKVWTLVIAFLDGNSKIGLRQAVVQVPYYGHQPSVLSSTPKWWRR